MSRLAIFAHIFFKDFWDELRPLLENVPAPFDLWVNLSRGPTDAQSLETSIRTYKPDAHVLLAENIGRDIGGLFNLILHALKVNL